MISQTITIQLPFSGNYPISFPFGAIPTLPRIQKMYQTIGLIGHNGIDYAIPVGTKIIAVDDGVVSSCGFDKYFGTYITLKHEWGKSICAHLTSTNVQKGDVVSAGDSIGLSGKSGFITGPHLHFGIKPNYPNLKNGYLGYVDPSEYFEI